MLSFEPYSASSAAAGGALGDQLDAVRGKRADQLHQRVDIAAHDTTGCLHALDRRERQAAAAGELALIDAEQGARGSHLSGGDHRIRGVVRNSKRNIRYTKLPL